MLYLVFAIITVSMFLYLRRDRRPSDRYLAMLMATLILVIFFAMLYIARDPYYYNVLNQYFPLPAAVWRFIMGLRVPRAVSLRGLNISAGLLIFSCGEYALHYRMSAGPETGRHRRKILHGCLTGWVVLSVTLSDPGIYRAGYMAACDTLFPAETMALLGTAVTRAARTVNLIVVVTAVLYVLLQAVRNSPADFFRRYTIGESVGFAGLSVAYLVVFWFAPSNMISVSRLAGLVTYRSLPLLDIPVLYQIYPVYLITMGVVNIFFNINYVQTQSRLARNEMEITCRIDAANTTSKAFCHYMKNELLALQAEIDMLEVTGEQSADKQQILNRFEHLYQRLDEVHRSTSMAQLTLRRMNLCTLMDGILTHFSLSLKGILVRREYDDGEVPVLCDAGYFEQAVHNILMNAVEAMNRKGGDGKELIIRVSRKNDMAQLIICDNGIGIPEENMARIFSPFYSTEPVRMHWGMGLTVTYRIVQAHRGVITASSRPGEGTEFCISLPILNTQVQTDSRRKQKRWERIRRQPEKEGAR